MRSSVARATASCAFVIVLSSCNAVLGPSSPDAHWVVHERTRFTFYVRLNSFAEQALDTLGPALDDQFTASTRALDLRYDGHIAVFLHDSGNDAGFGDDAGGGDHSGVAYPQTETVKSVAVPPLDGNLMALIAHEVNHVIIQNGLGRPGTTFVSEGLASALLSERYHTSGPSSFHRWVATHRGQFPPLAQLLDDDRWRDYATAVSYTTSASFLAYVIETYGAAPLRAVYPAASSDFAGRFRDVYGVPLEQAETAWLAYCDARR
jgi:hypothetical protein